VCVRVCINTVILLSMPLEKIWSSLPLYATAVTAHLFLNELTYRFVRRSCTFYFVPLLAIQGAKGANAR